MTTREVGPRGAVTGLSDLRSAQFDGMCDSGGIDRQIARQK